MTSWRTAAVALLSFSSGLPLGLVWIAIPDWLRSAGVDIRLIGLVTLTQAPWSFKLLWSPLMDRFSVPGMGRRRGWAALTQIALFSLTLALAGVGHDLETPWVVLALALAIAVASASQDIAVDAYAVDILLPEEQGIAVGARTAMYRGAMFVAGGASITLAGFFSWPVVSACLAVLYLPMVIVSWKAPEPPERPVQPQTLREAVWLPFLGFLSRHRALEILAFVFFYKFADNLAQALLRPFLVDMGYSAVDRGVALATMGLAATLVGTFLGGALTTTLGLGHSLWIFGFLQIFSNIGYILIARVGMNRPLMYSAITFETLTQGMGTGAFFVLLLRMTQKRFSATQYALFSSLFALPRIVSGPISGFAVDALGWEPFFWCTILAGIPGMLLLQRFSALGVREPHFEVEPPRDLRPLTRGGLIGRGFAWGALGLLAGALCLASMAALKTMATQPRAGFDLLGALRELATPSGAVGWLQVAGLLTVGIFGGLCAAAVSAARHGGARELDDGAAVVDPSGEGG
ncbi:MAG: MFS transporter [Acidobacteriota bacterium]